MRLSKQALPSKLLDFGPLKKSLEQLVSLVGVEKTIKVLEDNYKKQSLVSKADAVYVRNLVGKLIGCSEQEMLYGKTRTPSRYLSIGFCCYYLHVYLRHDMDDVLYMMNKNQSVCYKSMKAIGRLDEGLVQDQKYIEIKSCLDRTMREYKLIKK